MALTALLLVSLLLQSAATGADTRFTDWFIRLFPIAISLYVLFSGRSREDRKALDQKVADLILAKETQQERIKGMQLEFERSMDDMLNRHKDHEQKLNEVGRLREDMATVKAKLEGYGESINEMKGTLRNIESLLRSK
jgi:hypothetical protein